MRLTRIFLITLLVSLSIAALLGIGTILFDQSPDDKVFGTATAIALFSFTSLACCFVLEKRLWRGVMLLGCASSGIGLALWLSMFWIDHLLPRPFWYELLGKTTVITTIASITLAITGLQALTHFDNNLRHVRTATLGLCFAYAAVISLLILFEPGWDDLWFRVMGVLLILTLLGLVANPVLYKIAGAKVKPPLESTLAQIALECPRCRTHQTLPRGDSRCTRCRLKFTIEIEEPRCPKCRYLLYQLTTLTCPECGQRLAPEELGTTLAPAGAEEVSFAPMGR